MNRLINIVLAIAALAVCLLLWHLMEKNAECKNQGGTLLRDLTGYVCVIAHRVKP